MGEQAGVLSRTIRRRTKKKKANWKEWLSNTHLSFWVCMVLPSSWADSTAWAESQIAAWHWQRVVCIRRDPKKPREWAWYCHWLPVALSKWPSRVCILVCQMSALPELQFCPALKSKKIQDMFPFLPFHSLICARLSLRGNGNWQKGGVFPYFCP